MAWYNWSRTAATNATADASINMAEGMAPSAVNDGIRALMARTAEYRDDVNGSLTTGGTSTAFTLATNSVYDTLAHLNGQSIAFTMSATSGAAPTLNVDSLGAKPVRNSTGVTLPTGALVSGSVYRATYFNAAGEFLLENQPAILPTNSVVTASITDANVTLAKIVNTAASRLLGNPTGSAAAPSEISLAGGLAFASTTLKATTVPFTIQRFTSGTALTYTTPAGCTAIRIRMVGGGGGGGGGNNSSASTAGGSSTFSGGTLAAGGGGTASGVNGPSAGGVPSGGNVLNITGGSGQGAAGVAGSCAGMGGSSAFGGAGAGAAGNQAGSSAATNSGGGGGGGGGNATASVAGGGGAGGYVEHIISSPAASYTYTVGAGGAGATGTSAGNGGAGAAGIIIVEEYY